MFFRLYKYIVPLIFFPIPILFWNEKPVNLKFKLIIIFFPVLYSYAIPWFGIVLKRMWRLGGRFHLRWQSGLINGSFMGVLFTISMYSFDLKTATPFAVLLKSIQTFSLFALWNWLFDTFALTKKYIECFNLEYSKGMDPASITLAYAPLTFGLQGILLTWIAYFNYQKSYGIYEIPLILVQLVLYITVPTIIYETQHRYRKGISGLVSFYDGEK